MRGAEYVPFCGETDRLSKSNSADSVVLLLKNGALNRRDVLKWNRCPIESRDQAARMVKFAKMSIDLYEAILGKDSIVPTEFVIGEKRDGDRNKIKVYEVQDYISGWDGKNLPEDLRQSEELVKKWERLYSRVSVLYTVGNEVNRQMKENGKKGFPIQLTLGISRRVALSQGADSSIPGLPKTPNILIDRNEFNLHLCDLGPYTVWEDEMQAAYDEIYSRAAKVVGEVVGK